MKIPERQWLTHEKAKLIPKGSVVLIRYDEKGSSRRYFYLKAYFCPDWVNVEHGYGTGRGQIVRYMLIQKKDN